MKQEDTQLDLKIAHRVVNRVESKILELTHEENDAINEYQSNSSFINELMGNFISDEARDQYDYEIKTRGREIPYYTEKKVKDALDSISFLYSAMVKNKLGNEYRSGVSVYRGSDRYMTKGAKSFLSSSKSSSEARLFATSKSFYNHNLKRFFLYELNVSKNVPYMYMPKKGNEQEVLISPFVTLKESYSPFFDRDVEWSRI